MNWLDIYTTNHAQAPEITLDDLLETYEYIKAARPKGMPEAIIITQLIPGIMKVHADDKVYYLCNEAAWLEIRQHLTEKDMNDCAVLGVLWGIQVIRDDERAKEIMLAALEDALPNWIKRL